MKTSRIFLAVVFLLSSIAFAPNAQGQNKFKLPFRSSKPKHDNRVQLSQDDGPWLIMCASFVGEDGEIQANQLVRELRANHNLRAFTYRHRFDFGDSIEGIGWEVVDIGGKKDIVPKRMKTVGDSQFEEIAVLVGDFPNVEDSRAQRTLEKIKKLQPQSLSNFDPNRGTSQTLRNYREIVRRVSSDADDRSKGPLGAAFLLPNPLLPSEYFEANRVDHFVLKLNKNVKYSLMDNPRVYSVRVASFRGDSTFKLDEIQKKEKEMSFLKRMGKPVAESKLAAAAEKAHLLTVELRRRGVEAYEFHDRHESYVCVGSYDWISREDASGVKRNNPEIVKVINTFKATVENLGGIQGAVRPQQLAKFKKTDIVFDAQPIPVLVPKTHVSATSRFGNWK